MINQKNAVKDRFEGGIRTLFSHEGLELKNTLTVSMGKFNHTQLK